MRTSHERRVEQLPVVAEFPLQADLRRVVAGDRHALDRREEGHARRVVGRLATGRRELRQ